MPTRQRLDPRRFGAGGFFVSKGARSVGVRVSHSMREPARNGRTSRAHEMTRARSTANFQPSIAQRLAASLLSSPLRSWRFKYASRTAAEHPSERNFVAAKGSLDARAHSEAPTVHDGITAHETAKRLGVSYRTLLRMIERGDIAALRVGREWRVPTSEVERIEHERWQEAVDRAEQAQRRRAS